MRRPKLFPTTFLESKRIFITIMAVMTVASGSDYDGEYDSGNFGDDKIININDNGGDCGSDYDVMIDCDDAFDRYHCSVSQQYIPAMYEP